MPTLSDADARSITELADGFPQMAVLGAQQNGNWRDTITSAEQMLDRVIWGERPPNDEGQRALEILSLFEWVGFKGGSAGEAGFIAERLAGMTPAKFVDLIMSFRARGVLSIRGGFIQVLPVPLAVRLGEQQLNRTTAETLVAFFLDAPEELKMSLLGRMRWHDVSPIAKKFAQTLLKAECFGNVAALNSESGAKSIDRLVHVDPDRVATTLDRVLSPLTRVELTAIRDGRNYLVWALEKLAFRKESFDRAATLLRKLAATETMELFSNTASDHFKQLFQPHLSGTEADPAARLLVLDEGLASADPTERQVCFDALENMLVTRQFLRSGSAEQIGSQNRLQDWYPRTVGEIRC